MHKKLITVLFFAFCCSSVNSQNVSGWVFSSDQAPLVGATVFSPQTNSGTISDINGAFEMARPIDSSFQLFISYVGYLTDTITISDNTPVSIYLQASNLLDEVHVTARQQGTFVSAINPIKTEVIGALELTRSACCDLAGCFGTEGSVQVSTTNIVTNTKELRVLGLSGVYNQLLIDGFPLIQGLGYTYGLGGIPGTQIENIYIAKGTNSVLQGFESISGQINVTMKTPAQTDPLFVNVYANNLAEKQLNLQFAKKGNNWSSFWGFHTTQPGNQKDHDGDNFLDSPLISKYSFFNKHQYRNSSEWGRYATIGFRIVDEKRIGGQLDFDSDNDAGGTDVYGQIINFTQPELFVKTGYRWDDTHHLVFMGSGSIHNQNSSYGTLNYDANQLSLYFNLQYERNWSNNNTLKTGISYRHLNISEQIDFSSTDTRSYAGNYRKNEHIPGVFAENSLFANDDKIVLITGARLDHLNNVGLQFTPRSLLKWQVAPNSTLRFSAGIGWRTANIFPENSNLLASSRNVIFNEELKPEKASNFGLNFIQNLSSSSTEAFFSVDYYLTRFQNQIFPDYESSPIEAIISNFEGRSVSNSLKIELNLFLLDAFNTKIIYNYLDVYKQIDDEKIGLPFYANHSFLTTLSYQPINRTYQIDASFNWYGKQKLADTQQNPEIYQLPDYSDSYTQVNLQITKTWKQFEVYTGIENLFDFRQEFPILGWQDPFGPHFDTSFAWGPTRGREFYFGVRYRITNPSE